VLLIDARFQNEEYASLLPEHFHPFQSSNPAGFHAALKASWHIRSHKRAVLVCLLRAFFLLTAFRFCRNAGDV
jgi:hypothetical protein